MFGGLKTWRLMTAPKCIELEPLGQKRMGGGGVSAPFERAFRAPSAKDGRAGADGDAVFGRLVSGALEGSRSRQARVGLASHPTRNSGWTWFFGSPGVSPKDT